MLLYPPRACEDAAPSPFCNPCFKTAHCWCATPRRIFRAFCACAPFGRNRKNIAGPKPQNRKKLPVGTAESEKYFRNAEKEAEKYFRLDKDVFYTVSDEAFFGGAWDAGGSLPRATPCARVGKTVELAANGCAQVRFHLTFARRAAPAVTLARGVPAGVLAAGPRADLLERPAA